MLIFTTITNPIISLLTFFERGKICQKNFKISLILAQRVLLKICANLIDSLVNFLFSPSFLEKHRKSAKDFTRKRKLPFHTLVCFFMNLIKGSYQHELDKFFQALTRSDIPQRIVSKAALCKARAKLKYEAFIELNRYLIEQFEHLFQPITWHGLRLLAVDGSTFKLMKIKEIIEHFGVWKVKKGDPCPMARVSQLFDTQNKVTISAVISPKSIGERLHAKELFLDLMPNDCVLLDRGYPAFWLFKIILMMDAQFCARISTKWKIIREFINSGKKQKIVCLNPSSSSISACNEIGVDLSPISVRLIRVELDTGEVEVLITSLTDKSRYPFEIFADLYHRRWPVEEDYKTQKCFIEVECFTGKSVQSIYQDFHSKIFTKNLASILAFPVNNKLKELGIKQKYVHQINFVQALSKIKGAVVLLFQRTRTEILAMIKDLHLIFTQTTEPIRPGRKFPRKHKTQKRTFHINYKPVS